MNPGTYFFTRDRPEHPFATETHLLPIPLFKGMVITVHGYEGRNFRVVDWSYHHGHDDEMNGLRIFLE